MIPSIYTISCIAIFLSAQLLTCEGLEEKYMSLNEIYNVCDNYTLDDFNIFIINCSAKNIKKLPATWPSTRKLILSFNHNPLLTLPQLAESLADVISLSLVNCSLTSMSTAAFIDAVNISYLDLSWNLLTGESLHSDIFRGRFSKIMYEPLRKLKTLHLSYNRIHNLNRRIFKHLPNLKSLSLTGNPLKIISDSMVLALQTIQKLEYLDLSSTLLETTRDAFENIKKLRHLILKDNSLVSIPESVAATKDTLRYLDVSNNSISLLNDESFLGLSNLRILKINNMKYLSKIHAGSFTSLSTLRILNCINNPKLEEIDNMVVSEQWSIQEIYLQNNSLSELPDKLLSSKNLSVINLSHNPWNCTCKLYQILQNISSLIRIEDRQSTYCYEPMSLYGTSIYDVPQAVCANNQTNSITNTNETFHIQRLFFAVCGVTFSITLIIFGIILSSKMKLFFTQKNRFSPIRYTIATPMDYR